MEDGLVALGAGGKGRDRLASSVSATLDGTPCAWRERLSLLASVALAGNFVEEIFEPIIEMQAEAEAEQEELLVAEAKAKIRAIAATSEHCSE